jgi:hypothetical protein
VTDRSDFVQQVAEKRFRVIQGRAESANPESNHIVFIRVSGFRIAASRHPE